MFKKTEVVFPYQQLWNYCEFDSNFLKYIGLVSKVVERLSNEMQERPSSSLVDGK